MHRFCGSSLIRAWAFIMVCSCVLHMLLPGIPLTMRGKSPLTPLSNYCAMLLMHRCWGTFSGLATSTLGLARVQTLWTRTCKGNPRKGHCS